MSLPRRRIFSLAELPISQERNLRGGEGPALCRTLLTPQSAPEGSAFCAMGINVLPPGSSIGLHQHPDNEEIYLILSGAGLYLDNEGNSHPVRAGDAALCPKGESHGIINSGAEDLMMAGIVAAK